MTKIFHTGESLITERSSPIPDYFWKRTQHLGELANARFLHFDIMILPPDKFSYPYHSHRNAEELFYIIRGKAILRSQEGFTLIRQGDLIHFEPGLGGAHQLYNHTTQDCVYLDIRTKTNVDVCDYPDSDKVNILPDQELYQTSDQVDYFAGEENVRNKWPEEWVKR
jgi:uncharacterized cupin superfamily protein